MSRGLCLLVLSLQGIRAYARTKGGIDFQDAFAETDAGFDSFRAYLASQRSALFRILVDLPDENYRTETVPPARGRDRDAIIERSLARFAHSTPYACAVSQGREITGRRDERLLLASLTRPSRITPWLDLCREAGARIQTITSPGLLLERLTHLLHLDQGRHLLFSRGANGIRQTYFDAGRIQFSRLSNAPPSLGIESCFDEAPKVLHYINGSLSTSSQAITLHAIVSGADAERLAALNNERPVRINAVPFHVLQAALGMRGLQDDDGFYESLLIHLLAQDPVAPHFATAEDLQSYRLYKWRRRLSIAAGTATSACVLAAAGFGIHAYALMKTGDQLEAQNQVYRQQYQARLDARPAPPAPAEMLRTMNANYQVLLRHAQFPQDAYRLLSHALDQVPGIEVKRIEWRLGPTTVTTADLDASNASDGEAAIENLAASLRQHAAEVQVTAKEPGHVSLRLLQGSPQP